jgi:retron-type reverse transcriptase
MERIVCDQVTRFFEVHGLLPDNQHGFRAGRSTMTALAAMQEDWVRNWDQKMLTGILLWDLSAAYDTLNPSLLCEKLRVYGFDRLSCQWFESFLKGRKQSVRIGKSISRQRNLESGVPQGGILSPIIFTIFGADLEDWTKSSTIFSYADDTSSSSSGESVEEVKRKLEQDAEEVLKFMA